MDNAQDTYKTVLEPSEEVLFKDRKSKFYGYVFPINDEDEVKPILQLLKKKHRTSNHICYAWQLGIDNPRYRANDDGEPNNSAGMPIYGQIQSFGVTNVLIAVARHFGGTKLGVGGLIGAYRTTAQMALEASTIVEKAIETRFQLSFDYAAMDKVMRVIKQYQLETLSRQMLTECSYIIAVKKQKTAQVERIFSDMQQVRIKKLD